MTRKLPEPLEANTALLEQEPKAKEPNEGEPKEKEQEEEARKQQNRKQNEQDTKRRNQNAFNLLMMIAMLLSVIYIHDRFTAYFTQGKQFIPFLRVAGKRPQLYQLGLDQQYDPNDSARLLLPKDHALQAATDKLNSLLSAQAAISPLAQAGAAPAAGGNPPPSPTDIAAARSDVDNAKAAIALEYANRLNYTSFTALYVIICLMAVPVGAYIMFNTLSVYPPEEDSVLDAVRRHPAIVGAALAALAASYAVYRYFYLHAAPLDVEQILRQTIKHDVDGSPNNLYNAFNAFGMAVTVFLAAAAVCVMWHPRIRPYAAPGNAGADAAAEANYKMETEARYLGIQLKQLRLVLYISTAVLILRILQTSAGMNWALAFVIPQSGTVYDSVKTLVNSFVTVQGVYHTSLLAAIYLPTASVLSERIAKLADQENMGKTSTERKQWLDDRGLSFDAMAQVPNLLAILAPLLAGPAKDLISHISGH